MEYTDLTRVKGKTLMKDELLQIQAGSSSLQTEETNVPLLKYRAK